MNETRHERDHEFIAELRGVLRFLTVMLGLNVAGIVYLVVHGTGS
jgi:hypothetical protein